MIRQTSRVLALIAVIGIPPGFLLWDAHRRASDALERHRNEVRRMIGAARTENATRPVLFLPEQPGRAWDWYEKAFQELAGIQLNSGESFPVYSGDTGKAADFLAEGLRRIDVDVHHPYEQGLDLEYPYRQESGHAASVLIARMGHLALGHADGDAMKLLVVVLGFVQDAFGRGKHHFVTLTTYEKSAFKVANFVLRDHDLSAAECERLSRCLERLQSSRPDRAGMRRIAEALDRQDVLLGEMGQDSYRASEFRSTWRNFFSPRFARLALLRRICSHYGRLRELNPMPPAVRKEAADALDDSWVGWAEGMRPDMRYFGIDERSLADYTLVRVCLALVWFESKTGAYPAHLGELVPRYLSADSLRPFAAGILEYLISEKRAAVIVKDEGGFVVQRRAK